MIPEQLCQIQVWLKVGGILLVTWLALFLKRVLFNRAFPRVSGSFHVDPLSIDVVSKIVTIVIYFVALLLLLENLGIDVLPILTLSGIGAAAVALAGRDAIANFFGGVVLYAARSFGISDFIELPQKQIKGNVEEIGWYFTTVRDLSKRPIYIPNSLFSTELVLNHSRISHRFIDEKVRFRNSDPMKAQSILKEIRQSLKRHKEIDQEEPIHVYLLSISPYGMVVEIKAYTVSTRYEEFMQIKEKILLEIHQASS